MRSERTGHTVVDCNGFSVVSCRLVSPLANGIETSLIERRSESALDCQVLDLTGPIDNARKHDDSRTLDILRTYRINSIDDLRRDHGARIRKIVFRTFRRCSRDAHGRGSDIGYDPI